VSVHAIPVGDRVVSDAWNDFDEARRQLEAMYAAAETTRDERLLQCQIVAANWQRWQSLFLRRVA
jgi:hypothetical protein